MAKKNILSWGISFFFLLIIFSGFILAYAQIPTLSESSHNISNAELVQRVYTIEVKQDMIVESLKSSNDSYRFFLTVLTGLFGLLVIIQSAVSILQWRREGEKESRQSEREDRKDSTERLGADEVLKIMSVVQQTLESRLVVEKLAQGQLEKLQPLLNYYSTLKISAEKKRKQIEDKASDLAKILRQDFRNFHIDLKNFVQDVNEFNANFVAIEGEDRPFSSQVVYILGIEKHYSNDPEPAEKLLSKAVAVQKREVGEDEIIYKRRVANAYYYLGLIKSNFGKYEDAIDNFNEAKHFDPAGQDPLTLVVTSDAYLMMKEYNKAIEFINDAEKELGKKMNNDGALSRTDKRLLGRAKLNKASIELIKRQNNWLPNAQRILEEIYKLDPYYYYATATLAQIHEYKNNHMDAQKYFDEALRTIERSRDLITVSEIRIRILLLMVAGMCARHGSGDKNISDDYLAQAKGLCKDLPKIGDNYCTVFSPLSKRNEDSATIADHIAKIGKGEVLSS